MTREASLTLNQTTDSVELAFATDTPVARGGYTEILDVKGMDLTRLNNKAQVLFNHNWDDYVGVVENARIDADGIARASILFGSSARAKEVEADVRSGVLSLVSFGYYVRDWEERSNNEVVVTDFEPFEISIVTVPADPNAGVGRTLETPTDVIEENKMTIEKDIEEKVEATETRVATTIRTNDEDLVAKERQRVKDLNAIADKYDAHDLARQFVNNGGSVSELNAALLERMGSIKSVDSAKQSGEVGMTDKEVKNYSFKRLMRALIEPENTRAQKEAAYEFEVGQDAASELKRSAKGVFIPQDVLTRSVNVGTDADGGYTVDTVLAAGDFISLLRNKSIMMGLGNVMTGLVGDLAIPRQTGGATAYWVAEDGALTTSTPQFDLVNLTPKSVGATTYATRKILLQSEFNMRQFILNDLATTVALEVDRAAIAGSGASNQPTGILNTSGIGSVSMGANGGAITRDALVDLESELTTDNADLGNLKYVTNAKVRGAMRKIAIDSGSGLFLLPDNANSLLGYDVQFTNQVPSNLDQGTSVGVCSAAIFGNFSDLMIGLWSGIDLIVDPYSNAKKGGIEITAFQDMDIAVRHPESFAAIKDITTA